MKKSFKYISILIIILMFPLVLSACKHKTKTQTSITDYTNLDSLYLNIVDKMTSSPIVTDKKNTYIAVDISSMKGISENCKASIVSELKPLNNIATESFISLEEKGMRGSDGSLKGVLIYIERIKLTSANHVNLIGVAYISNKNLISISFNATYLNGDWSLATK
ncbi:MAG TPA: hypothetical protein VIK72_10670 [Clostridiaceae bacterium]